MPRVLLLLPAAGYRNEDFLAAAEKLDVEVVTAADYCHRLAPLMGMSPILSLHFDQPEIAAEQALVSLGRRVDAVLAVTITAWNPRRYCEKNWGLRAIRCRRYA
jgi:hypothetical protein